MLAEMTWPELVRWRQYAELEPFGEERADLRIGYAFAKMASMFRGKGRGFKATDFISPSLRDEKRVVPATRERFDRAKQEALMFAQAK